MRIRLIFLPLIIVGLAVACQSTPESDTEVGADEATTEQGPTPAELEAEIAGLRRENAELSEGLADSTDALGDLEGALAAAVAPEETGLSRQELLGRARALRQENEALRRVIDELLYLDTLGGLNYSAPRSGPPVPDLPPGTLAGREDQRPARPTRPARPATPTQTPPPSPPPAAAPEPPRVQPGPVVEDPPAPEDVPPTAQPGASPGETVAPRRPATAVPTRPRSDGFLETEVLAVPPRTAPSRQRPPLGSVIPLRLIDDADVAYVDHRANFLSESPLFLGMTPDRNSFQLKLWAVARYPGSEPALRVRSVIVQTPSERYLLDSSEGEIRQYVLRGQRVEVFSQGFGPEQTALVEEITKADAGTEITVTFVGSSGSRSYSLSQSDREAILNVVYAHRSAGGRLP